MKTPGSVKRLSLKRFCVSMILGLMVVSVPVVSVYAGSLFIDPASPLVQVGGKITLSVTNASGDVKWSAFEGEIERTGNSVKYKAPDYVAIDAITAKDSAGNIGTAAVVIQEKEKIDERFSKENANWEIFTNRDIISELLISDDGSTLWVGTEGGGVEDRDAVTGELRKLYTKYNGLSSNYVRSLLSDGQGGVWVGTDVGLSHFKSDGTRLTFDTDNSDLPNNVVRSLLSDGQGGVWVGTYGGLSHFKSDGTWLTFNTGNSDLPHPYVLSLASDGQGGVWVGTWTGLSHFKLDGTWLTFNTVNSDLPYHIVKSLLSDGQGGIWVGTNSGFGSGGLSHFKSDGTWLTFNRYNFDLLEQEVASLASDGQGSVWIGTQGGGFGCLKSDGTWLIFNTDNSDLPDNVVRSLLSDGLGGIWVGTRIGLSHFKSDDTWMIFDKDNSALPSNYVYSLLSDGQGGIWIGTDGEGIAHRGGIAHFKTDGTWQVFNKDNSDLPSNNVDSLLSDGQGGIWIGMGNGSGLSHFKTDGTWQVFNENNSDLPSNSVKSLLSDGQGGIWIGTDGGGMDHEGGIANFKTDGTWQIFNEDNSDLPSNRVGSLSSDGQEGLWVEIIGSGIAHFKTDGTWQVFNEDNSKLPSNNVDSLLSDGLGGIWVGSHSGFVSGGLSHFKSDGTWQIFNTDNSGLPDNLVWSLAPDGQGGLWIGGFYGVGLSHFSIDGIWMTFNANNSDLPDTDFSSLLSDGQGGVWVGTGGGGLAHLTFSSPQIQDEQYLTRGRAAIIIAGGGNTDDNLLWDSTAKISNYTYNMLNKRGFLNTDIHYISPQPFADFNGDGLDDKIVDAPVPARQLQVSDVQAAFDWAKTKGELNQPLYIFFTDHGGMDKLQLAAGVYIEAAELKSMVDDYQQSTGNKVVFVIDACHSGSMVKALAGEGRAIISSTDDGLAYFDRTEDQSFTWFVTKGLSRGMNFVEAFHYATSEQKELLGKLTEYSKVSGGEAGDFSQEPQYDDTGDGVYIISDEGKWLKQISVNGTWTKADITLTVEPVTQSGVVSSGLTSIPVLLKARATLAAGVVRRVWAVIRPPQMDILVDDTGVPLLAFPKTDLSALKAEENTDTEDQNIYEGTWNGFIYNGEYEISFYAEDNEGNIESSESITLTVADGMECPQKASVIMKSDKALYKPGESLTVSATENLAYGYDLYMILFLPDGRFTSLQSPVKDSNGLQQQNFNQLYRIDRWMDTHRNMGKSVTIIDMMLPQEKLPAGQYCLYAVLIPEGEDLINAAGKGLFVLDGVSFEIVGE